jgi:hypothetical protein
MDEKIGGLERAVSLDDLRAGRRIDCREPTASSAEKTRRSHWFWNLSARFPVHALIAISVTAVRHLAECAAMLARMRLSGSSRCNGLRDDLLNEGPKNFACC